MKKIIFAVIFVVVIVGGYYFYSDYDFSTMYNASEGPEEKNDEVAQNENKSFLSNIGDNVVLILEQPSNITVTAHGVKFSNPGHMVIHKVENNIVGEIVGVVGLIPPGEYKNVKVNLNQLYESGAEFAAMLHFDDGDGTFDPLKDLPVTNEAGEIVMMKFRFNDAAPNPEQVNMF